MFDVGRSHKSEGAGGLEEVKAPPAEGMAAGRCSATDPGTTRRDAEVGATNHFAFAVFELVLAVERAGIFKSQADEIVNQVSAEELRDASGADRLRLEILSAVLDDVLPSIPDAAKRESSKWLIEHSTFLNETLDWLVSEPEYRAFCNGQEVGQTKQPPMTDRHTEPQTELDYPGERPFFSSFSGFLQDQLASHPLFIHSHAIETMKYDDSDEARSRARGRLYQQLGDANVPSRAPLAKYVSMSLVQNDVNRALGLEFEGRAFDINRNLAQGVDYVPLSKSVAEYLSKIDSSGKIMFLFGLAKAIGEEMGKFQEEHFNGPRMPMLLAGGSNIFMARLSDLRESGLISGTQFLERLLKPFLENFQSGKLDEAASSVFGHKLAFSHLNDKAQHRLTGFSRDFTGVFAEDTRPLVAAMLGYVQSVELKEYFNRKDLDKIQRMVADYREGLERLNLLQAGTDYPDSETATFERLKAVLKDDGKLAGFVDGEVAQRVQRKEEEERRAQAAMDKPGSDRQFCETLVKEFDGYSLQQGDNLIVYRFKSVSTPEPGRRGAGTSFVTCTVDKSASRLAPNTFVGTARPTADFLRQGIKDGTIVLIPKPPLKVDKPAAPPGVSTQPPPPQS